MEDNSKNNPGTDMEESESEIPETLEDMGIPTEDVPVNGNPEEQLLKLQNDLAEQKDKYLRLVAEFENYKRRNARERIDLMQTAGKEIITSLLGVLDDCDRAENQMKDTTDAQQVKEGVLLVFNKLRGILQAKGLTPMESIGSEFDVEKHEAISEIPMAEKAKKGKVADEVERGYYLNGKLIRFAKVVVGK